MPSQPPPTALDELRAELLELQAVVEDTLAIVGQATGLVVGAGEEPVTYQRSGSCFEVHTLLLPRLRKTEYPPPLMGGDAARRWLRWSSRSRLSSATGRPVTFTFGGATSRD